MAEQRTRKRDWFRDGVWLAGLAGIASAELVTSRVMEALEVRQEGDLPVIDALIYRLRPAELLLVLDNREHLLDACAGLTGTLLADAPLGRGGELVFAAKGRQACNQGSASVPASDAPRQPCGAADGRAGGGTGPRFPCPDPARAAGLASVRDDVRWFEHEQG